MEILTGEQDFVGQQLAESHFTKILNAFGVIGWIVGFFMQSFAYTFYIIAAGALVSILVAVPAWPMYRQNPVPWLPGSASTASSTSSSTSSTSASQQSKKKDSKKHR